MRTVFNEAGRRIDDGEEAESTWTPIIVQAEGAGWMQLSNTEEVVAGLMCDNPSKIALATLVVENVECDAARSGERKMLSFGRTDQQVKR